MKTKGSKKRTFILITLSIVFVVTVAIILFFVYQYTKRELMHYDVPVFDGSAVVSTGNGSMSLDEISGFLSQFTNEDGTGEINLNMTVDEIAAILHEKGISYEMYREEPFTNENGNVIDLSSVFAANGNDYYSGYYASFKMHQTKKGLIAREPVSRAIEIYGEPDLISRNEYYDNLFHYYYNMGKKYCKLADNQRTVVMDLTVSEDTVVTIEIRFLNEDEEIKLFKQ